MVVFFKKLLAFNIFRLLKSNNVLMWLNCMGKTGMKQVKKLLAKQAEDTICHIKVQPVSFRP